MEQGNYIDLSSSPVAEEMAWKENPATVGAQGEAVALSLGCLVRMTLAVAAYSRSRDCRESVVRGSDSRKGLSRSAPLLYSSSHLLRLKLAWVFKRFRYPLPFASLSNTLHSSACQLTASSLYPSRTKMMGRFLVPLHRRLHCRQPEVGHRS